MDEPYFRLQSGQTKRKVEDPTTEELRSRGAIDNWKKFSKWVLGLNLDQVLTDVYCCLTSYLRQAKFARLAEYRKWRIHRQWVVLGERLRIGLSTVNGPCFRLHLQKLARLRVDCSLASPSR